MKSTQQSTYSKEMNGKNKMASDEDNQQNILRRDTFGNIESIKEIIGNSKRLIEKSTMRVKDKLPWVDKYRPKVLQEVIGHTEVKNVFIATDN